MVTYIYTLESGEITGAQATPLNPIPEGLVEHTYEGSVNDFLGLFTASPETNRYAYAGKCWPLSDGEIPVPSAVPQSALAVAAVVDAEEMSFEDWRQQRIDQMSVAVGRVLARSDWVEIRQADPSEPTKLSDSEFEAFRETRRARRKWYEDYKEAMLTLETTDLVQQYQQAMLLELEAEV
jgi:hypothetical protein